MENPSYHRGEAGGNSTIVDRRWELSERRQLAGVFVRRGWG